MTAELQGAFRALSDPTRREILTHLAVQDMTIGEIAARFPITRSAVKKHLTILQQGQLISVRTNGRERVNSLEPQGFTAVVDWVSYFSQFWASNLAQLKHVIENEEEH